MKNNHKYFPEDNAREIIERHLEDAGPFNKPKIEKDKENNGFKIIFNNQDRNEAVKDALKLSMSLLNFESYKYNFQKYPIIFIYNNEVIVNANELTGHDIIKDIYQYLYLHNKSLQDISSLQSILRFYKGIIHILLNNRQASMRSKAYHERQNDLNMSCGEYLASKHSIDKLMIASKLARSKIHQQKASSNEFFLILLLISISGCFIFVRYEQLLTAIVSCWGAIGISAAIHKNFIESTLPKMEVISEIINIAIEESKKSTL